jgi:hypothetical protein
MHPRQQIREAVAARLAQQLPDGGYWTPAETRVHASRSIEIVPEELPLVLVSAREETSTRASVLVLAVAAARSCGGQGR